jgi:hypothetical protein
MVNISQANKEEALRMVQRAVYKLKQRWRYRQSSEVSSSQTETEVALRMIL